MSELKISLRAARVNAGLTQEQAADKIGIARQTLVNYETGKTFPDIKTLRRIADVYGIDKDRISFFADNP